MTKAAELAKMGEVLTNSQIGGRRNIIINGAMQVAQRGTSSTSSGRQTLDRFEGVYSNFDNATQTQSQDSTAPNGFKTSYKIAIGSTAESAIDADEQQYIRYKIEGQDLQQLKYGTSDAESMTLSFYVRSSLTGTFSISFFLNDTTKNHVKTYTISSANTWERKTITVSPNTSDVIDNDNGIGLSIHWFLTLGSDRLGSTEAVDTWIAHSDANFGGNVNSDFASNANATFFLTGVQLEVGSVATPFEHRSFGEERNLCYRYYYRHKSDGASQNMLGVGVVDSSSTAFMQIVPPVSMRDQPSSMETTGTASNYEVREGSGNDIVCNAVPTLSGDSTNNVFNVNFATAGSLNARSACMGKAMADGVHLSFTSEL